MISRIHEELGKPVMADVDTIEAAIAAEVAADLIATTLYGYTAPTSTSSLPGFDLLTQGTRLQSICEVAFRPTGSSSLRFRSAVVGTHHWY